MQKVAIRELSLIEVILFIMRKKSYILIKHYLIGFVALVNALVRYRN